jgi:hypothetical protein
VGKIKNQGSWEDVVNYEKDKLKIDAGARLERELGYTFQGYNSKEYIFRGFSQTRQWRFDLADAKYMIAIEIEGGTGKNRNNPSRHLAPEGFQEDCHKYGQAAAMGWIVIRVTPKMIYDDTMIHMVRVALRVRSGREW